MRKKRDVGTGKGPEETRRWDAIHRFLDNLSPLPERHLVERWMRDDVSVQRYIRAHQKVWAMIARRMGKKPLDPEQAWESVQDRVAEHDRRERFNLPGRGLEHLRVIDGGLASQDVRSRRLLRTGVRLGVLAAAGLLVAVTSTVTVRHFSNLSATREERAPSIPITYTTRRGMAPLSVELPDGSHALLAPDSRMEFMIDRAGAHIVTLVGEAYFSVQHRTDRRFVVRADGIETQDLGTEFDVRAYPNSVPRIAVRSGRVLVRRTGRPAATVEGGFVSAVDASGVTTLTAAAPAAFAWTVGRLAFVHEELGQVLADVGRKYDLGFEPIDPTISALRVTITVSGDTPEHFFTQLRAILPELTVERHGQRVRLFRR